MTESVARSNKACGLLAATLTRPECEGDGAPKSAKSLWLVPCGTRAPRGAPIAASSGNGPCFRPVRRASNAPTDPSASSWQGLLVVPEGAPLPPECLVATRPAGAAPRPAFATPRESAPQKDEVGCIVSEVQSVGIVGGITHHSRHPGESRDPGATHAEQAALDTGFRRYDGVRCWLRERQPLRQAKRLWIPACVGIFVRGEQQLAMIEG